MLATVQLLYPVAKAENLAGEVDKQSATEVVKYCLHTIETAFSFSYTQIKLSTF